MPNDDIVYLLKFASKEAYINELMDGCLYINAAGTTTVCPESRAIH